MSDYVKASIRENLITTLYILTIVVGFGGRILKWPYWKRNAENKNLIDQHLVYSPEDHFPFLVTWEMSEILKLLGKCLLHQIANSSGNLHNKCRVKTS